MEKAKFGKILWHDLTIPDADTVSDFYCQVLGWQKEGLSMGDYDDYIMKENTGEEVVAGVCNAKGSNSYLPPQWLLYVAVPDLDASLEKCVALGGKLIGEKRKMGKDFYCLVQDPAGAHMMLCSANEEESNTE